MQKPTKKDIRKWLLAASKDPKITHVAIIFDWPLYYPQAIKDIKDFLEWSKTPQYSDGPDDEAIVEEVYDMSMPIEDQLNEERAWHTESHKPKVAVKKKFRSIDILIKQKQRG